jgi:hypothetical protein
MQENNKTIIKIGMYSSLATGICTALFALFLLLGIKNI